MAGCGGRKAGKVDAEKGEAQVDNWRALVLQHIGIALVWVIPSRLGDSDAHGSISFSPILPSPCGDL